MFAAIVPHLKLIYMNESKKDLFEEKVGTMNFSKAHELGHWILHVTKQKDYKQISFSEKERYYCRSFSKKPPEEIQADMFAAAVLMPKNIICGAIEELKSSGEVTFSQLYDLAGKFEISISALTNRLRKLGLLHIANDKKIYFNENDAMGQIAMF